MIRLALLAPLALAQSATVTSSSACVPSALLEPTYLDLAVNPMSRYVDSKSYVVSASKSTHISSSTTSSVKQGHNGNPPGGHGSGTGGGKGGHATPVGTIVGAVIGSVVGASAVLGAFLWWLLRRRRAIRKDYTIDLLDVNDELDPGTATAVVTPLMPFHHTGQSTSSVTEKGRPYPSLPPGSSTGYTSAQLSNSAYESTAAGSVRGTDHQAVEFEQEIDAEAPLRQAGGAPPPSYDHVLWVTRPDAARAVRPPSTPLNSTKSA